MIEWRSRVAPRRDVIAAAGCAPAGRIVHHSSTTSPGRSARGVQRFQAQGTLGRAIVERASNVAYPRLAREGGRARAHARGSRPMATRHDLIAGTARFQAVHRCGSCNGGNRQPRKLRDALRREGTPADVAIPGSRSILGGRSVKRPRARDQRATTSRAGALAASRRRSPFLGLTHLRPIRETMGIPSGVRRCRRLFWGTSHGKLLGSPSTVAHFAVPPWHSCRG